MNKNLSSKDWEALSAYLDNQLSASERNRLEAQLEKNLEMKLALEKLSQTRRVLRSTPKLRAPRSFALTPEMAGLRPARPRLYPVFRLAFAVASILFVLVFASDLTGQFSALYSRQAPVPLSVNIIPEAAIATSGANAEKEAQAPALSSSAVAPTLQPPQTEAPRTGEGFAPEELPLPEADSKTLELPTEMMSKVETGEDLAEPSGAAIKPSPTPTTGREPAQISETEVPELIEEPAQSASPAPLATLIRVIEVALGGIVLLSGAAILYLRRTSI